MLSLLWDGFHVYDNRDGVGSTGAGAEGVICIRCQNQRYDKTYDCER